MHALIGDSRRSELGKVAARAVAEEAYRNELDRALFVAGWLAEREIDADDRRRTNPEPFIPLPGFDR